jgi:hypothetical protein
MSIVAVWSWASDPGDVAAMRAALDDLVAHCEAEHPLIQRLEWLEASSREAMENDQYTDVCEALWQPVKSRALADTFVGKAYERGGGIFR